MIVVEGKIKSKQRPRFFNGHAVTPEQTVNYENWVKTCYQQQSKEIFIGSLKVEINAYFEVPKSYSKKKRAQCFNNEIRPSKKPDPDNIIKIVLDALNGIAYMDDAQVVEVTCKKFYTNEKERIEFSIEET